MKGIRIETEKIVRGTGELCRKITTIKALDRGHLPEKYLKSDQPILYANNCGSLILENRGKSVCVCTRYAKNELVNEEEFQALLNHCHKAGDHLMSVNADLKAKRAIWNGEETFII